jgi:NAD(P)-dependent dehydrogenase (short-subunit alcohol dehydrogenase family)
MGRFGEPEEIGELVLFMCSDACPFMTADTVFVNGAAAGGEALARTRTPSKSQDTSRQEKCASL